MIYNRLLYRLYSVIRICMSICVITQKEIKLKIC